MGHAVTGDAVFLQGLGRFLPDGDDLVAMCFTSDDFREGVESFLARRPARWTGR